MSKGRETALAALRFWRQKNLYVDDVIQQEATRNNLSSRDRAHAKRLAYGVLRNLSLIDFWISELRKGALEDSTRDILRIGIYDLLLSKTKPHAAVNETVSLAKKREKGLVNAILRRITRETEALESLADKVPPATQYSHPEFLINRWTKQYGADNATKLCEWNQQEAPLYARVNNLCKDVLELDAMESLDDVPEFIKLNSVPFDALKSGAVYIQDPSTRHSIDLLAPKAGEKVLDACASPGGKSIAIADKMNNQGELTASDSDKKRLERLRENLERSHVICAEVDLIDWSVSGNDTSKKYDAILLDAPCSNTGVMQRRVEVRHRISERDFEEVTRLQKSLLNELSKQINPGGRLVYSTCSIDFEENEEQVAGFLQENTDWKLEKEMKSLPWEHGYDGAYAALLVYQG